MRRILRSVFGGQGMVFRLTLTVALWTCFPVAVAFGQSAPEQRDKDVRALIDAVSRDDQRAVRKTLSRGFKGDVLVINCYSPLLTAGELRRTQILRLLVN